MKSLSLFLAIVVLAITIFPNAAFAAPQTSQVFVSASNTFIPAGNIWLGTNGVSIDNGNATPNISRHALQAFAGVASSLRVKVATAPGGGGSWTFTLYSSTTATSLVCSISGANTTCNDLTNTASFGAGTPLVLKIIATNAPASTTLSYSLLVTPTINNKFSLGAGGASLTTFPNPTYQSLSRIGNWSASSPTTRASQIPMIGTMSDLYQQVQVADTPPDGWQFVVRNITTNSTTSLMTSLRTSGGNFTKNIIDTTPIADGDVVQVAASSTTGTGGSGSFGVGFTPYVLGDFPILAGGQTTVAIDSATLPTYFPLTTNNVGTTTEADAQTVSNAMYLKKMEVSISAAPGAGTSRFVGLRINNATTTLGCTIAGAGTTTCTIAANVYVNDGDLLSIVDFPSGSPATATYVRASVVATRLFPNSVLFIRGYTVIKSLLKVFMSN